MSQNGTFLTQLTNIGLKCYFLDEERPKCHQQQSSATSTDDEIEDNDTIESHDNTRKEANGDLSDFTILKSDQFKKPISVWFSFLRNF